MSTGNTAIAMLPSALTLDRCASETATIESFVAVVPTSPALFTEEIVF